MTHEHPLQHPAHKNTPPCTSACLRAQLGPWRGTRSSPHAQGEPCTSAATPSRHLSYPKQAGNLRTKYDQYNITFKPQNIVFGVVFFSPGVLWTTHESKPLLLRQCLWKHLSWERTQFVHRNRAENFQPIPLFLPQTLPSFPPTLSKMTRQGTVLEDVIRLSKELC